MRCRILFDAFLHHVAFFQWTIAVTTAATKNFAVFNFLKLLGLILYGTFFAEDSYLQLNI